MLTETEVWAIKPVRYSRKVSDGGGLYLLVTPKGGRCWRYAYRFAQKHKTLALGIYPDVSLERARSRHEFARNPLVHGLDPSALKAALGKQFRGGLSFHARDQLNVRTRAAFHAHDHRVAAVRMAACSSRPSV